MTEHCDWFMLDFSRFKQRCPRDAEEVHPVLWRRCRELRQSECFMEKMAENFPDISFLSLWWPWCFLFVPLHL